MTRVVHPVPLNSYDRCTVHDIAVGDYLYFSSSVDDGCDYLIYIEDKRPASSYWNIDYFILSGISNKNWQKATYYASTAFISAFISNYSDPTSKIDKYNYLVPDYTVDSKTHPIFRNIPTQIWSVKQNPTGPSLPSSKLLTPSIISVRTEMAIAKHPKFPCCGYCGEVLAADYNFTIGKSQNKCDAHGFNPPLATVPTR